MKTKEFLKLLEDMLPPEATFTAFELSFHCTQADHIEAMKGMADFRKSGGSACAVVACTRDYLPGVTTIEARV